MKRQVTEADAEVDVLAEFEVQVYDPYNPGRRPIGRMQAKRLVAYMASKGITLARSPVAADGEVDKLCRQLEEQRGYACKSAAALIRRLVAERDEMNTKLTELNGLYNKRGIERDRLVAERDEARGEAANKSEQIGKLYRVCAEKSVLIVENEGMAGALQTIKRLIEASPYRPDNTCDVVLDLIRVAMEKDAPAAQLASRPPPAGEKLDPSEAIPLLAATIMTAWRDSGSAPKAYGKFADMAAKIAFEFFASHAAAALPSAAPAVGEEDERAAFERWAVHAGQFTDWSRYGDGYAKPLPDLAWRAWKAARTRTATNATESTGEQKAGD